MRLEKHVQRELELAVGSMPKTIVLRNTVGTANVNGRWITYGLGTGSPDLVCIVAGRWVCFEAKRGEGDTLRPEQIACHAAWRECDAIIETITGSEMVAHAVGVVKRVLAEEGYKFVYGVGGVLKGVCR